MRTLILTVLVLLSASVSNAQHFARGRAYPAYPIVIWGGATPASSMMQGMAQIIMAEGFFAEHYGRSLVYGEMAREHAIKNNLLAVQTYWARKKVWAENRPKHSNYLDRLEQAAENNKKLQELRAGSQEKATFICHGKVYDSYEDFVGTPAWAEMKAKAYMNISRELADFKAERERQESLKKLKAYRSSSFAKKQKLANERIVNQLVP